MSILTPRPPASADPDDWVPPVERFDRLIARAAHTGYTWSAFLPVRWAYKRGMVGADVAAFQMNLGGVLVDGDFGRRTVERVIEYQREQFPDPADADGIAGLKTNQRLSVQRMRPATDAWRLPKWLLKSLCHSESLFLCGACARHPSDAGWDIGGFQLSSGPDTTPSQDFLETAYDTRASAGVAGSKARELHDSFPSPVQSQYLEELAGGSHVLFKWQMVVLNHNWPAAAFWIPRRGHIYSNPALDDQPTGWIIDYTDGRLRTPREWVAEQVENKTIYL